MAITDLERTSPQSSDRVDTLVSAQASEMILNAVGHCESKTPYRGSEEVSRALREEDARVHDCFRHSLAGQLARYLAQLDDGVIAVYSYSYGDAEEEGEDRSCSRTASIDLILRVRRKTAALSAAIASLDALLLDLYRALIAPHGDKMTSLLNVQMVDDRDVEESIGLGVVLRSTYVRPLRVWPE